MAVRPSDRRLREAGSDSHNRSIRAGRTFEKAKTRRPKADAQGDLRRAAGREFPIRFEILAGQGGYVGLTGSQADQIRDDEPPANVISLDSLWSPEVAKIIFCLASLPQTIQQRTRAYSRYKGAGARSLVDMADQGRLPDPSKRLDDAQEPKRGDRKIPRRSSRALLRHGATLADHASGTRRQAGRPNGANDFVSRWFRGGWTIGHGIRG